MALSSATDSDGSIHSTFASRYVQESLPRFQIPSRSIPKDAAYQIISDELMLDGNPRLNLASFVTTWMKPECDKVIMQAINKNYVDMDEYPVTTELQNRCVNIIANLFNAPLGDGEEAVGVGTVGSSEAIMLAGHILRLLAFMLFTIAAATVVRVIFQVTLYRVKTETRLTGFPLFLYGSLQESLMDKELDDYTVQAGIRENYALMENPSVKQTHGISFIQDIVLLPEEILFLVRLPSADSKLISHKSLLSCSFSREINTTVNGIDYLQFGSSTQPRAAVRCQPPPPDTHWSATSVALVGTSNYSSDLPDITTKFGSIDYSIPIKWDYMVYESFATDEDIVLFAKGINNRQGLNIEPKYLRCIFNNTIETRVTLSAQEIFRCEHPSEPSRYDLIGSKITLGIRGKSIPSVAYYEIPPTYDLNKTDHDVEKMNLCACTMVFNVAKYIREWVIYHSHLGVKHFFLYDNNSEDNLEETLAGLSSEKYMIKKHPWPWAKTQESGFSHCALMAKDKCQWMMYTDVDEFVFSPSWLKQLKPKVNLEYPLMNSTSEAALWQLVTNLSTVRKRGAAMIGQISMRCRNFGPSGLHEHPQKGVTQGYTCREKQEKRYKSILLLEAASPSLLNVIHRFQLKKRYRTVYLNASKAVINHYKYQAWSEFKAKFRRRVSAYVVDWKDSRNPRSQDRTPGLGNRAIKPHGWENMFCEVNDTALKEYTEGVFSLNDEEETGYNLEWQ